MPYQVLALKYRPSAFDRVVGQKPVVSTLRNALNERRIAHGYIFSGVRGVGKTTMARLFAKALNCEKGPSPEPCGTCDSCREVPEGRSLDVIEIDGASNSGVEKIRELLETARYTPARDRYKVFIIDEFHQISRAAFNALLKTLEEPPPHVVFVMATTEPGRVLPTILSRCQQFDFRRIPASDIAAELRRIASEEKVEVGDRTLALLSRAAGGSMRDALTALDQLIASCGQKIDDEEARAVLGVIPEEEVHAFLEGVADRDAAGLLRLVARVSEQGHDAVTFGGEIHNAARTLLVARTLPDPASILDLSPEETERAVALAGRFSADELLRVVTVLEELQAPLRYSANPRYLLESASVRLARLGELAPVEEILRRLGGAGAEAPAPGAAGPRAEPPRPSRTTEKLAPAAPAGGAGAAGAAKKKLPDPVRDAEEAEAGGTAPPAPEELPEQAGLFERILAAVEAENPALAASLGTARGAREEDGELLLLFSEKSSFRRRVEAPENLSLIARVAGGIAGRELRARVVSDAAPPRARVVTPPRSPAAGNRPANPVVVDRALADPAVRAVVDLFGARVVQAEEKK